jgi:hypothetical protein
MSHKKGCYHHSDETKRKIRESNVKTNNFSYVLNEVGQIDYVLVDIWSPKHGLHQMMIDLESVPLLKDSAVSLRKAEFGCYATQTLNGKQIPFHRRIFPDIKPDQQVDHISGNTLDNRRGQLKKVSPRENTRNTKKHREGHLYGTHFAKSKGKWEAYIKVSGKKIHLGCYQTQIEAHQSVLDYQSDNS